MNPPVRVELKPRPNTGRDGPVDSFADRIEAVVTGPFRVELRDRPNTGGDGPESLADLIEPVVTADEEFLSKTSTKMGSEGGKAHRNIPWRAYAREVCAANPTISVAGAVRKIEGGWRDSFGRRRDRRTIERFVSKLIKKPPRK